MYIPSTYWVLVSLVRNLQYAPQLWLEKWTCAQTYVHSAVQNARTCLEQDECGKGIEMHTGYM